MHDWSRVVPNVYHHFHQRWAIAISDRLNAGMLPAGFSALVEQHTGGLVPDVLAVERTRKKRPTPKGGVVVTAPPATRLRIESEQDALVRRASRVAVRHQLGDVVCIIEIVSPGNKTGERVIGQFVAKTTGFLRAGVNVLLVDPFPPTTRDPQSLHKLIWDELHEDDVPFEMPADEPLLLAAYQCGDPLVDLSAVAHLEPFRVGAAMPDMPAYLDMDSYVNVPLEATYTAAWESCPADVRYLVEHGRLPDE